MNSVAYFQSLIEKEVREYSSAIGGKPIELYEPLSYMLSLGGKRMRPVLVLTGCDLFDEPVEKAINAALAVEVFHNFTLIHDDIMDNAPLRRNKETVFKKWNANTAILSGDAMLVKAYQLLNNYKPELLSNLLFLFNKTALEVCEGQQLDMNYEKQTAGISEYLEMIELKTAVLLAASLKMGATVAGADDDNAELLYDFGKNIGIAFQLQDDILDAFGDPEKFGKQPGGDIISNKKTFLYLKADELADETDRKNLEKFFSEATPDPTGKVEQVINIFNKYQIKEAAKKEMNKYFSIAKNSLEKVEANKSKKEQLLMFAESLMEREI